MKTSFDRKEILQHLPFKMGGRVVEVGVLRGLYSKHLLEKLAPAMLTMVDPWGILPVHEFGDYTDYTQAKWDKLADSVRRRFAKPNVTILRMLSEEAQYQIPDKSQDLIYIDANHDYEYIRQDLGIWVPKVKPGGWIAGHDVDLPGVKKALAEVVARVGGTPMFTNEKSCVSFFLKM